MNKLFLTPILFSAVLTMYFLCGCSNFVQADETEIPSDSISSTVENFSKLNKSDMNSLLGAVGVSEGKGFDIAKMVGYFIFGGIGFVAFVYGKKNSLFRPMVIGIVLNIYPYFISSTLLIYIIGIALTAALFVWRD